MKRIEVAIVGAGPYGLSIAAHLAKHGIEFAIFGGPMTTWRYHMPKGMLLKSDGFASSLSAPGRGFALAEYCALKKITYDDLSIPVSLSTFADYGLEFQKRCVPSLDERKVARVETDGSGYLLALEGGEMLASKKVVLATGISHFQTFPPELADADRRLVSHSSAHRDPAVFKNKDVAVVGAGASAVDLAVLMQEAGARPCLIFRSDRLEFSSRRSDKKQSMAHRLRNPMSGLGPGIKSKLCCEFPHLFRFLPEGARLRFVDRHLGPSSPWYQKAKVNGRIPQFPRTDIVKIESENGGALLHLRTDNGVEKKLPVQHVVCATGYRVDLENLTFLDPAIRGRISTVGGMPKLTRNFESSVPGLYFAGIAAAATFGPLMRFVFGTGFAAPRIASHLVSR